MGVLADLKRFQLDKEDDLRRYMVGLIPSSEHLLLIGIDCLCEVSH